MSTHVTFGNLTIFGAFRWGQTEPRILRFDSTDFGGRWDFHVPIVDLPEYPFARDIIIKRRVYRSRIGTLYTNKQYSKERYSFQFREVSSTTKGTIGSLALENKDFLVHLGTSITGNSGIVGTFRWFQRGLKQEEISDDLWNFDFVVEEV